MAPLARLTVLTSMGTPLQHNRPRQLSLRDRSITQCLMPRKNVFPLSRFFTHTYRTYILKGWWPQHRYIQARLAKKRFLFGHLFLIYICCEQQRERAAQPSEEPQRGVNSVDGKVKRNHLNTPRYEYSDVYTHGDKTGQLRWTHLSGDVCV